MLLVEDAEAHRLGRDLLEDRDQREQLGVRAAEPRQLAGQCRHLPAFEVVEQVPDQYRVEAGILREIQQLAEAAGEAGLFVVAALPGWTRLPGLPRLADRGAVDGGDRGGAGGRQAEIGRASCRGRV